jgi:hypothetical protein
MKIKYFKRIHLKKSNLNHEYYFDTDLTLVGQSWRSVTNADKKFYVDVLYDQIFISTRKHLRKK